MYSHSDASTIGILLAGTFLVGFFAFVIGSIVSYFSGGSDDDNDRAPTRRLGKP